MEFVHIKDFDTAVILAKTVQSSAIDDTVITPPVPDEQEDYKTGDISNWGSNNLYPQDVLLTCEKDDIISSGLDWRSRALYGGGLELYNTEDPENRDSVASLSGYEEFAQIIRHRSTRAYTKEAIEDFYWHGNIFPTLIPSADRAKLLFIHYYSSPDCRLSLQDKAGISPKLYVNANWRLGRNDKSVDTIPVSLVNKADYYAVERFKLESREKFAALHCHLPKKHRKYYALPAWHSIISTGWMDIGEAVTQLKKFFIKNQMTLKYIIYVQEHYWKEIYKDWDKMTDEQRAVARQKVIDSFTEKVKGEAKAGSTLLSTMRKVAGDREYSKAWIIEEVPTKTLSGEYLPDSQEATQHKLWAMNIDSSLIGPTPGRNSGGENGGSSKRESFNMYMSMCQMHIDIIVEPLEFMRDYNGYDYRLGIRFRQPFLQMLNQVTPSQRNTTF